MASGPLAGHRPLQATERELRAAYLRLCLATHPDRCKGEAAAFLRVQEAYDVLRDPELRSTYDLQLLLELPFVSAHESCATVAWAGGRGGAGGGGALPFCALRAAPLSRTPSCVGRRPRVVPRGCCCCAACTPDLRCPLPCLPQEEYLRRYQDLTLTAQGLGMKARGMAAAA